MEKEAIEMILMKVIFNNQEAVSMKLYKDGTICKQGIGAVPSLETGMMMNVGDSSYFMKIIEHIPQSVLDEPLVYNLNPKPESSIEFVLAFYGKSINGNSGEDAQWSESTGVQVKVDPSAMPNDQIMMLLDTTITKAIEITNSLYFDAYMFSRWNAKSKVFPDNTIINAPKSQKGIHDDWNRFIEHMKDSARKWDVHEYARGKVYVVDGQECWAMLTPKNDTFIVSFQPTNYAEKIKKKPWWKF